MGATVKVYIPLHLLYTATRSPSLHHPPFTLHSNLFIKLTLPSIYFTWQLVHQVDIAFHLLYTATQVHFALRPQKRDGLLGTGTGGEEEEQWRLDRGYRLKKTGETVDHRQNNGSVKAVSPRHCAATSALRNCCFYCRAGQSHKDNVHCTAAEEQLKAKEVQLSQPSSTSWSLLG